MGHTNFLLLSQLSGNIVVLILSLCIIIPMSMHESDFNGYCLLFSTGDFREIDGQFMVKWASQGFCNYTIFVGVVSILLCSFQIYRLARLLYLGQDSSFRDAFLDVVQSAVLCTMTLVAALFITLGFEFWCKSITKRFETCSDAADNDIDEHDKIDTSSFYIQIGTAQFGAWASWASCVGLCVFATLKLIRYHQEENMRVSMARARERLIKKAITDNLHSNEDSTFQRGASSSGSSSTAAVPSQPAASSSGGENQDFNYQRL